MLTVPLRAQAIAWTHFAPPPDVPWSTDTDGGQALAEFAGRACYQSWDKPNPATATNAGYLANILDVGHGSVLEHGTVTFYLTGVSRSLTHELIRHRHFSYSQLSQRYVPDEGHVVVPEVIAADPYLWGVFTDAAEHAAKAYAELVHGLERTIAAHIRGDHNPVHPETATADGSPAQAACAQCLTVWPCKHATRAATAARKKARQAARAVLPNATETRIVVTGNYRAWRHFITMRAAEPADAEIRAAAVVILEQLQTIAPHVFRDFHIITLPDGTRTAHSHLAES